MSDAETIVFLHGLGDGPDSWNGQLARLPAGFDGVALDVPGLGRDEEGPFGLARSAERVVGELDRRGIRCAHLCGLSLGAMIAFRIAVDRPERVRSLTLAAGQVRPPRALMAIQSGVMRVLPERAVASGGASKERMLAVLREVARVDSTAELAAVRAPTLVVCGSRDRANLPAARTFAAGIPGAALAVVPDAGHRAPVTAPDGFAAPFHAFLGGRARDARP